MVKSGLYGLAVVRSSLTSVVLKRKVGVTGLNVLIAMIFVLESPRRKPDAVFPFLRNPFHLAGLR
jgi:hypothetical protein